MKNRFFITILCLYALSALLSTFGINPWDVISRVGDAYLSPSYSHWLGTDYMGRDIVGKIVHGARISMYVGLASSLIAIPLGAILGAIAGYFGGWIDDAVVWIYSTFAAVPQILMLTAIGFVMGNGLPTLCIAVGITSWVGICRLIRAEVLKMKKAEYITAAHTMGASSFRILFFHIFPNLTNLLFADFTLRFVYAIKSEAILSYLGLGIQSEPSWGLMIADAKEELVRGVWWELAGVSVAMFAIAFAMNVLGDELQDARH